MARPYSMTPSRFQTTAHFNLDTMRLSCSHGASGGTLWASCSMATNLSCELTINRLLIFGTMVSGLPNRSLIISKTWLTSHSFSRCREDKEEFQLWVRPADYFKVRLLGEDNWNIAWLKGHLENQKASRPPGALGRAPSLRTLALKQLSKYITSKKEGTPAMTMIDMRNLSKITCHLAYLPRLQQRWTHKSWLYRYKCMRRCRRSISDRKRRSNKRSTSKTSAGRLNNILRRKRLLLMGRELLDSLKTRRNSPRAVKGKERTISSHLQTRVVQLQILTSISELGRALLAANQ